MNKKGFTILELLAAILVITIGILTTYAVVQRIFAQTIDSANRIQAVYLAKEGIEVIRNTRDTNWINDRDFDYGLPPPTFVSPYSEIPYDEFNLVECDSPCDYDDLDFLNIDGNGFYSYSAGTTTKFKRRIKITPIAIDELKIEVEVFWQKRGQIHSLVVQENLYDWK